MEHVDPVRRLTSMVHSHVFVKDLQYLMGDFSNKLTSMLRNFAAIWRSEEFEPNDPGKSYKVTKDGCLAFRTKGGKTAYAMTTIEVTIGPVLSEEEYALVTQKEVKSLL